MQKLRYAVVITAALFGFLIAARAISGPLAFPISIRTPINIESVCALLVTVAFLLRREETAPGTPKTRAYLVVPAFVIVLLVIAGFWRAIGIYFLADDFVLVTRANAFYSSRVKELLTTA